MSGGGAYRGNAALERRGRCRVCRLKTEAALTRLNILLMREDWQGTLACIQSFGRRGHRLTIGTNGFDEMLAASDYVSATLPMPRGPDLNGRAEALIAIVEEKAFDLVVPLSDDEAHTVACAAHLRPDITAFVAPSLAAVEIVRDRNATAELCRKLGVPYPDSLEVDRDGLADAARKLGFPCFLKFSQSVSSSGVERLDGTGDLERALALMGNGVTAQLQKAVVGEFLGMTGFCLNGQVVDQVGFACDYDHSMAGTPPYARLAENAQAIAYLERIAQHLNWTGGIDLDLLQDEEGHIAVLEINPRLSGTVNIALAAGKDIPGHYHTAVGARCDRNLFAAKDFDVFASLLQEAVLCQTPVGWNYTRNIRATSKVADNGYPEDRGYARALERKLVRLRRRALFQRLLRRLGLKT